MILAALGADTLLIRRGTVCSTVGLNHHLANCIRK
jgi:hypothetical protein